MSNGEFKKENRLEINIAHEKEENQKKINSTPKGKNNVMIFVLMLLNLITLIGIIYFGVNQYFMNLKLKEDLRNVKEKVNNLEGLNSNLEKLNANFQILDIVNSNTRQIPDILIGLEENKRILKNLDVNELNKIIEEFKGNESIKNNDYFDFDEEFKTLENNIKLEFNMILDEKLNKFFEKIPNQTNEINIEDLDLNNLNTKIENMENVINEIKGEVFYISQNFNNEIKNYTDMNKKINDIYSNGISLKVMINNISKDIEGKYSSLDDVTKGIENKLLNYNAKFVEIENKIQNIKVNFSNLEKSQNEYYKKLESLIINNDTLDMIKNLDMYINKEEEFKLIEMINLYNDIVIKYNSSPYKDKVIEDSFKNLTKKVYDKFLNIINKETEYLKKAKYNLNIKKDIRYISYVFYELPKVDISKYNQIDIALKNLKKIENIKIQEYNKLAIYYINKYLELFSKKKVFEEEIINNFKTNILVIEPDLLEEKNKELYYNIINKTKDILKDKYVW